MVLAPQLVCSVCGKAFTYEPSLFSTQPTVSRVRHCANGNSVEVAGKVTRLLEVNENRWVQPVYGDLIED